MKIEELMNMMQASMIQETDDFLDALRYAFLTPNTIGPKELDEKFGCQHDWEEYKGLTEEFEYCKVCNERKG